MKYLLEARDVTTKAILLNSEDSLDDSNLPISAPYEEVGRPVVTITSEGSRKESLREIAQYRELVLLLAWREIRVRYKQTLLGLGWLVLQPLMTTLMFTAVLGFMAHVPSEGRPYALFVFVGLIPWNFYVSASMSSGSSLIANANLLTKVYFPRVIIPVAAGASRLLDLAISLVLVGIMMAAFHVSPTLKILMLPVYLILLLIYSISFGLWVAAFNLRYRDLNVGLPVLMQLWMYATPVVYPVSLVPVKYVGVYRLNPMVGIVQGFHSCLLGDALDLPALWLSIFLAAFLFFTGLKVFYRSEHLIADII